jgi:hypothetical protein
VQRKTAPVLVAVSDLTGCTIVLVESQSVDYYVA